MIARRRRRVRVRSGSLRTLFWVVRREAAVRVLFPWAVDLGPCVQRRFLAGVDGRWLVRVVEEGVSLKPERRFFP